MAVAGGGGGGGGAGGKGSKKGKGKKKAPTKKGKKPAKGAKKSAKSSKKKAPAKKKKKRSDPVDVVTGAVTTHPREDVSLLGPLPLSLERAYDSEAVDHDLGFGHGWGCSLCWRLTVHARSVEVIDGDGVVYEFDLPPIGDHVVGLYGILLRRESWGFVLDTDDDVLRSFSPSTESKETYLLTAIDDRNGNRITIRHDGNLIAEVVDSAGRTLKFDRDGDHISTIRVRNAETHGQWLTLASYWYDDADNLIRVEDPAGFAETYAYDENHRLQAFSDKKGLTYHYRYDEEGRCVETWGAYAAADPSIMSGLPEFLADGRTRVKGIYHCRFDYMPEEYTEVTDTTQVCRYMGNEFGLVDKSVEGVAVESYEYDEHGHVIEFIDGQGARWTWERDERGRVLSETDPLGNQTRIERNEAGWPIVVVDEAGQVVRYTYDTRGNPLLIEGPTGVISLRYDQRGLIEEIVRPNGVRLSFTWDGAGNLLTESVGDQVTWRYSYDSLGQVTAIVDPLGAVRRFAWGPRGELLSVLLANGSIRRYEWDEELNLVLEMEPDGSATRAEWGGRGVVTRVIDAGGKQYRFEFDWEQQLRRVTNPAGEQWTYEYDANGRLIREQTFDGRCNEFSHDASGSIQRLVDPNGQSIQLTYDLMGRVVARECSDGELHTFQWGATGRLLSATFPRGVVEFERDGDGNVVRERQTVDGETHVVESAYDPDGLLQKKWSDLGYAEQVVRDSCGRRVVTEFMGRRITHVRDLAGNEIERRLPGSGRLLSQFDPAGNLLRRLVAGPTTTTRGSEPEWVGASNVGSHAAQAYQYVSGHLRQVWDQRQGLVQLTTGPLGELIEAVSEVGSQRVQWDGAGNPHPVGEARVYAQGSRLLRRGSVDYRYDAAGRLVERIEAEKVRSFRWNDLGMLVRVEDEDGVVEFVYDPFARRLAKQVRRDDDVIATRFVWDSDRLLHEKTNQIVSTYAYDDDTSMEPMAHHRRTAATEELLHYFVDRMGTPRHLLDDDGNVVSDLQHEPFRVVGSASETPFRFLGQQYDADIGLTYNRYRYYDQDSGQFISPDPLGLSGGLQDRAFVSNSWENADPLGLKNLTGKEVDGFIDTNIPKGTSGVYTIVDKDGKTAYVGKANDVNSRLKSPGHKKARDLLKQPGTTVKVQKVDTSKVGKHSWKNPTKGTKAEKAAGGKQESVSKEKAVGRTLMVEETTQYKAAQKDYPGVQMSNSHQPLSEDKYKEYKKQYPPDTSGGSLGPFTVPG